LSKPLLKSAPDPLDATFTALADPTRRKIIERLTHGRATVGEVAQPFDISGPAVTKHLRVLERAGLIRRYTIGPKRLLELNTTPMAQAEQWMKHHQRFWEGSLDALADYLERGITRPTKKKGKPKSEK